MSRRRLAASDLSADFRGARSLVQTSDSSGSYFQQRHESLLRLCRAYVPVAPDNFRFSHVTAARLHGIPLPEREERRSGLDVTVGSGTRARRAGVIGHRVARLPPVVESEGLPVVPVEQAWLQLGAVLTLDELIVAGDHLVRRKRPPSSLERMADLLAAANGQRGIALARRALLEVRAGTDSPPESRLRLLIVRAGLPEPVIGHTVYSEGYWVGTPDLAYVRERIALDFDGRIHRDNDRVYEDDVERRQLFADADWRYITVTNETLRVPRGFLARLERLLAKRG